MFYPALEPGIRGFRERGEVCFLSGEEEGLDCGVAESGGCVAENEEDEAPGK